jgi:lipopolysaccharide/colanic/teichoic acid biosynthesis glycosyltransferase
MSLVGPRPERPEFIEEFRKEIPVYILRQKVKSGLTGLAQVRGWRGATSLEKRVECDIQYIEGWSLGLDLKILWLTLWKGFVNKAEQ